MAFKSSVSGIDEYAIIALGISANPSDPAWNGTSGMYVNPDSFKTINTIFETAPAGFTFTLTGLRPSTRHFFYFNRSQDAANCQPLGGALGSPLYTDSNGKLTFTFFYHPSTSQPIDTEQAYYDAAALVVGEKQCVVGDAAYSTIDSNMSAVFMSYAQCTISMVAKKYADIDTIRKIASLTTDILVNNRAVQGVADSFNVFTSQNNGD